MGFSSVAEFLEAMRNAPAQTYKEIILSVDKSPRQAARELRKLVEAGDVNVIGMVFGNRPKNFYTVRDKMDLKLLEGTTTQMIEIAEAYEFLPE